MQRASAASALATGVNRCCRGGGGAGECELSLDAAVGWWEEANGDVIDAVGARHVTLLARLSGPWGWRWRGLRGPQRSPGESGRQSP